MNREKLKLQRIPTMVESNSDVQTCVLETLRDAVVTIVTTNGEISGVIQTSDAFTILVEVSSGSNRLVYKSQIVYILFESDVKNVTERIKMKKINRKSKG